MQHTSTKNSWSTYLDIPRNHLKQYEDVTSERSPSNIQPPCASVDLHDLKWPARLVRDYCGTSEALAPFFVGPPNNPETWVAAFDARRRQPALAGTADVVAAQLEARGAPAQAKTNAGRLREPTSTAVVTGQQAGLFGGPIYTLLKALTTIKLARQLSETHHVAVIPVFWVDADDHDLAEIRTASVLNSDLELAEVSIPEPDVAGAPASAVLLTDAATDAVSAVAAALPDTEFSPHLLERLAAAYRPGAGIVRAFCEWLDEILGPHGLVVFDASDPAAKSLVGPLWTRELETPGETARLATEAGTQLTALGYHAQVTPVEHAVSLFSLDGTRQPIRYDPSDSETFTIGATRVSRVDVLDRARSRPETFSPNVLLRPIVQDALFPSVAYVAGPSELAYLGQLRKIYEAFDVPMPVIYPRATATVVDRSTQKFLDRYDVAIGDLQSQDDQLLNRLASSLLPESVETALAQTENVLRERLDTVRAEISTVDPTLAGAVDTTVGRMTRDLGNLRGKVAQAAKRRDETLRRQFHRARALTFPGGAPQERAVGFLYLLNRGGPHIVEHLMSELSLDIGRHWLLPI